jgi:hypothetical protein
MREIRPYGSVRGVRRKPYPYRDNILPVRSTAVPLPRNEMEDQALFACDTEAATVVGRGF